MRNLSNIHDQLFDSFIDSARRWIIEFEDKLILLEKHPDNEELINDIFRIVHNIKGISGTVNLNDIHRFAHSVEDVFLLIRQNKVADGKLISALLEAADFLWLMVESVASNCDFDFLNCEEWIKKMENYRNGGFQEAS